jgi:hypothetical protein
VPAPYCPELQVPPTDELDGAIELDDLELGTELLEGAIDERDEGDADEGALELVTDELAPSQLPSSTHSCHWPE